MYYVQNENPLLWEANYDEERVPPYHLPDLLTCNDGEKVLTCQKWQSKRRAEVMQFFQDVMYGKLPPVPDFTEYQILSVKPDDLDSTAVRKEIRLSFKMASGKTHNVDALLYLPSNAASPVPVFLGLTFIGNHATSLDKTIAITGRTEKANLVSNEEAESIRGKQAHRFPVKEIIQRGYALMTASYHDFFPDRPDGWSDSIYTLFYDTCKLSEIEYQNSALSAWAWGISRLADLAETLPELDGNKMISYGHSRLGKSSLWAGANDQRFALVCVNDSGCGGTALSRRLFGETLFSMCYKNAFGHWFRKDLHEKTLQPEAFPMDQHGLVALIAPRAIAVHSASDDIWADPYGEYLGTYNAGCVYKLFNKKPLENPDLPPINQAVGSDVSYLLRQGPHELLLPDWQQYLDAADRLFK